MPKEEQATIEPVVQTKPEPAAVIPTAKSVPTNLAGGPVDIDQHESKLADLRTKQLKNRKKHLRCLDPETAKEYEASKPTYEWQIEVELFRTGQGKKNRPKVETLKDMVVAQDESTAWAIFCDKIGEWPSRRDCNPTIKKLKQRTARYDE